MRMLLLLAGLGLANAAQAAPLTFDQALDLAARKAPAARAATLQVEAATAAARAAGRLPDPQLGFGLDNYPVTGPVAGRLDADEMTMGRLAFSQEVPNGAKRRAEVAKAQAEIGLAAGQAAVTAQAVRLETAKAWVDLLYAQKTLTALDDILARLEPLWETGAAGVSSGRMRSAQALEARQMQAALQDRRSAAEAELARARSALRRWTGEADPEAFGAPPDHLIDETAFRAGLDRRPALQALDAGARQARADLARAKADKRPDWSWDVAYQRRDPMFGDMVSAGVSVTLPLWGRTRQDPVIAARTAGLARAEAEREDARLRLAADLDADLADHSMHHDQWVRARDVLVPLAKQRAELETAAYGAGTAGLPEVLSAFSGLADAQLTLIEREAAVTADSARLRLTYGDPEQ